MFLNVIHKTFLNVGLVFAFIWLFFDLNPGKADYLNTEITNKEKAVFAFFKASNDVPSFEDWVKESALYRAQTSDSLRQEVLIEELLRLGRGYGKYDADVELIEIEIPVYAKIIPPTDDEAARFSFKFDDQGYGDYIPVFNYPYGKSTISLLINKLVAFSNFEINEKQYQKILQKAPSSEDKINVVLKMDVKVDRTELNTGEEKANGGKHYFMIADIGYISCEIENFFAGSRIVLWDYVAPWNKANHKKKYEKEDVKYPHPYDLFKDKKK